MRLAGHSQAGGHTWLFDCGEGTQRQLLSSTLSHARVERIFVSHMHGDHVWGLPSMVVSTLLDQAEQRSLHVYGPVGLHGLLVASLGYADCKLGGQANVVVHELVASRDDILVDDKLAVDSPTVRREPIAPDDRGVWRVYDGDHFAVTAAAVKHTAPCFGYVVDEKPRKRRVDADRAARAGLPPGRAYRDLQEGRDVSLQDGRVVRADDVTSPPPAPRRVVVVGDTCRPSDQLRAIADNADVVVHEATMCDADKSKAVSRGHSTPSMAGTFARNCRAHLLVLTHFSGRFLNIPRPSQKQHHKPPPQTESVGTLVVQAQKSFGSKRVLAAQDFLCVSIPRGGFVPNDKRPRPPTARLEREGAASRVTAEEMRRIPSLRI